MMRNDSIEHIKALWADVLSESSFDTLQEAFESAQQLMSRYRCAMLEVETKFRVLDEQFSMLHERNPIDNIKTRLKSPESIRCKLQKRGLPYTLESVEANLNDVAGIRIICPFVDDIYLLADCLTSQDDITLLQRKDYIISPKPNGYRSLHLIVEVPIFLQTEKRKMKVEVQLRTIAMEFWANLEHRLRYKKDIDEETAQNTAEELSECAKLSALLDQKMQSIRHTIEH